MFTLPCIVLRARRNMFRQTSVSDSRINCTLRRRILACTATLLGMLIQAINSGFRKDQLQQNRDQLQQQTLV